MRGRSLFARLIASHLLIAIGGYLALGIVLDRILERSATHDLVARLASEAHTVDAAIGPTNGGAPLERLVKSIGASSGARITVIRTDGVVLADSEHDPSTMENHSTRPEVRAALEGRVGTDQRVSGTLGRPFLYVAIPAHDGRLVRAALSAAVVSERRTEVRRAVAVALAGVALAAVALAYLAARSMARPLAGLALDVETLASGTAAVVAERGPPEIRSVARRVNAMAAELADRIEALSRETALRESILSSMAEGVVLVEPSGAIAYANPAAAAQLGGPSFVPPAIAEPGVHEYVVHHPQRRELRVVTARLDDGRTLIALQDVTESKRVEAMRRDFVADASHELKTPVAAVLAVAETLGHAIDEDPASARRFAAALVADARRLGDLVSDLLDLARFESSAPSRERASLSGVVRMETDAIRDIAERKGLRVESTINHDVFVSATSEDLALVARNLLDNAVRYTDRGAVSVRVFGENGRGVVEVSDTGVGIPAKDLPRIFERFYRVDKARSRDTGGTGLGLSIVRHVVEGLGGSVTAESELGRGSRFVVSVPRA